MDILNLPAVVLLLVFLSSVVTFAQTDFSQDSAFAILRTLSVDIGPRPMGSPAEQSAMQFAVSKLHEFGCSEAYIMPMTVVEGVNTKSGIAIGVLKGRTNRIIIIGGHIDSAGPDIPGANDDGSGTACVLELARVLCKRQHESTLMFCCWGGEEQGLEGSKYFVDHFEKLDSVDLMIQIDMADGASYLEIDPDYRQVSAPRWLTEASYRIFYQELHQEGLVYPVASAALNAAAGGATGSDHDSFLEKGIPAIDFTSDVDYPIHTPQDNLANFDPSGLTKTGNLVLKLVDRFDPGVPTRSTERYMLIQLGIKTMYVDPWMLWLIIIVSVLLAVAALLVLRGRSLIQAGTPRIRWPGIKLILYAIIIQSFIWLSETWLGWIAGYRFPWANHFGGVVVLGLLCGAIGLWLVLNVSLRFRLSLDAFVWGWRSLVVLLILTMMSSLGGPKLAVFFAASTGLMSLAMLTRSTSARLVFWILSCLTIVRIVFFEELGLIQRQLSENTIHSLGGLLGYEFFFILLFTIISLPFIFGFAAIYRDSGKDLLWLKRFRERRGLAVVFPAAALMMVYLVMQTPYGPKWYGRVDVRQECAMGADSCTIALRSSEYMGGLKVVADTSTILFDDRANSYDFRISRSRAASWCSIESRFSPVQETIEKDSTRKISRQVTIRSSIHPYRVQVRYDSKLPFEVSSPWAYRRAGQFEKESDRVRVFSWYSFPDTLIELPVTFSLRDTQRISEKIEITYDTLAYPMHLSKDLTNFEKRTVVTDSHEFGVHNDSTSTVSRQP